MYHSQEQLLLRINAASLLSPLSSHCGFFISAHTFSSSLNFAAYFITKSTLTSFSSEILILSALTLSSIAIFLPPYVTFRPSVNLTFLEGSLDIVLTLDLDFISKLYCRCYSLSLEVFLKESFFFV